jgi:ubiquinone/menaquinone biosynthesis C-methylase UbiE
MAEVNLLARLPQTKRNIKARRDAMTAEHIRISRQFGEMYFDGPREFGYGGYRYDGRWVPIAEDVIRHFSLQPGDRILDVGAAKGFLIKDLLSVMPGLDPYGLDISSYALMHCEPEVVGRIHLGNATTLPFPDNSFKAVISLNTIHNLSRPEAILALSEIQRVSGGRAFVQVDSYLNEEQKRVFEEWVLTARYHDYPSGWLKVFQEAGYIGDYYWTIID